MSSVFSLSKLIIKRPPHPRQNEKINATSEMLLGGCGGGRGPHPWEREQEGKRGPTGRGGLLVSPRALALSPTGWAL